MYVNGRRDSQCNLTAYAIEDVEIKKSWGEKGNSIYRVIQRVAENMGDIRTRQPSCIRDNLYLVPGDIDLNIYEDRLGETWASASVQPASIQVQFQYYTCYEEDAINIKRYKLFLYLDNQQYLYPELLAGVMAVNPFVLKCYGHFKFYMLMNHLKYE